jgi:NADH-quinone oxidoreductase subunit L
VILAGSTALSLIINGLAIVRIYTKIFMGAHIKTYHEIAYRSS